MDTTDLILHFDGSCTFNPGGQMGYGWVLKADNGDLIAEEAGTVTGYPPHESSCNTAEFHALLAGLEWAAAIRWLQIGTLTVRGDSNLVVQIVNGEWQARKGHLAELNRLCQTELGKLRAMSERVVVEWVPREENAEADELSTECVDSGDRPPGEDRLPGYARGMTRWQMIDSITARARWYKSRNPDFDLDKFLRWVERKHEGVFRQYFTDIQSLIRRQVNGKKPKSLDWLD